MNKEKKLLFKPPTYHINIYAYIDAIYNRLHQSNGE